MTNEELFTDSDKAKNWLDRECDRLFSDFKRKRTELIEQSQIFKKHTVRRWKSYKIFSYDKNRVSENVVERR